MRRFFFISSGTIILHRFFITYITKRDIGETWQDLQWQFSYTLLSLSRCSMTRGRNKPLFVRCSLVFAENAAQRWKMVNHVQRPTSTGRKAFLHLRLLFRCDKNTSVGVFTVCSPARMFHTCCHTHTHTQMKKCFRGNRGRSERSWCPCDWRMHHMGIW